MCCSSFGLIFTPQTSLCILLRLAFVNVHRQSSAKANAFARLNHYTDVRFKQIAYHLYVDIHNQPNLTVMLQLIRKGGFTDRMKMYFLCSE